MIKSQPDKNFFSSLFRKKHAEPRKLQLVSNSSNFTYVEAYKALRTNLSFMAVTNEYKSIAVTSSIPSEGKSNVAINLAVSLAETRKRVLLIDADLRKPILHKYLRIGRRTGGLTGILSGKVKPDDAIVGFKDLGIDVLIAGAIPPNPAELLGSVAMERLLLILQEKYDYVIVDTPPASVVTDAAALGRLVDGVILVVRQKYVSHEAAKLAKRRLEGAGVKIIGAVLNGFDAKGISKDSGYYYSYEYDYRKEAATQ